MNRNRSITTSQTASKSLWGSLLWGRPPGLRGTLSSRSAGGRLGGRPQAWGPAPHCFLAILVAFLVTTFAFAHGGFEHVAGTVTSIQGDTITVKTAKGDVAVKLTPKTEITKDGHKADVSDLKPGTRVVIDIPEGAKEKTAHSIKVGAAPK